MHDDTQVVRRTKVSAYCDGQLWNPALRARGPTCTRPIIFISTVIKYHVGRIRYLGR